MTTEEIEERTTKDGPLLALRLVIRVERDSQKGIVIGRGASLLRQAGTEARLELEALLGVRTPRDPRAGGSRLAAPGRRRSTASGSEPRLPVNPAGTFESQSCDPANPPL